MGMGSLARTMAFWLVIGTFIGSVLPEFGNLLALKLHLEYTHYFNKYFLVVGVLGILGFGLALYFRCMKN